MPIRFPCTACGQLLGIATRKVGTEINCPTCGLAVIVPDEEQAKRLRQQARSSKQAFPTPDTPPEISIPRESHEAFDGGLESFLTQLEPSPASNKTTATAPATKPAVPATIAKQPPPSKSANGTHAPVPRTQSATLPPATPPAAKTPPAAVPPPTPPAAKPLPDIPLAVAFDDPEVAVLSAADLLEMADESDTAPAPPIAKAVPPLAKQQVAAVVTKQSAAPASKAAVPLAPPKAPAAPPPASAPLLEIPNPLAADAGFDFSSPAPVVTTTPSARPKGPAVAPAPQASQPTAIPAAPFDNAVWISRRAIYTHVAILVLVSFVTFLIGWISGGAGARLPIGNNAGPVRFEAQIQYVAANGKTLPDEGAVILLWPKQAKPLERMSSKRLSPAEPPPPSDLPALKTLETLRGAYARTNAQGEVRDLLLAEPGEYYVLVISRNLARPANEPPNEKAIPILGDLFGGDALTLLGTRQFTLKSYLIADTRLLTHTFGAPAEAK